MFRTNNRTLIILILVLLLTNAVMLYLLTREEPKVPELSRSERMIKMVQDELGLKPEQVEKYKALRNRRDSLLKPIQSEMRTAKMEMIGMIHRDSIPADSLQAAAKRVGEGQAKMEIEYFLHFKRMQAMLSEAQQPRFDSLLQRMVNRNTGMDTSQTRSNR